MIVSAKRRDGKRAVTLRRSEIGKQQAENEPQNERGPGFRAAQFR